jgi:putative endonuclease
MDRVFYVYMLAGKSGVLYTGITSDLTRRVSEHKQKQVGGFTQRYNVTRLVWYDGHGRATSAIAREKQIKAWRRSKKVTLIEAVNPRWTDLSQGLA